MEQKAGKPLKNRAISRQGCFTSRDESTSSFGSQQLHSLGFEAALRTLTDLCYFRRYQGERSEMDEAKTSRNRKNADTPYGWHQEIQDGTSRKNQGPDWIM
jgi:hypothetical protein